MQPERLEYLERVEKFYNMLVEQAKQDRISESDFYMIIKAKAKAMEKERREGINIKVNLVD